MQIFLHWWWGGCRLGAGVDEVWDSGWIRGEMQWDEIREAAVILCRWMRAVPEAVGVDGAGVAVMPEQS